MENTIITVGREGDQPFTITGSKVSRKHCTIEVDGDKWTLRDLNSSHGTFIRNTETGKFEPVQEAVIDPLTFIYLSTDNTDGCTFYAYSVLHPDDYKPLLAYMQDKDEEFDMQHKALEKRVHRQKILLFVLNFIVFAVSLSKAIDADLRMWMLRIVPLASTGFAAFYDASAAKKKIEERRNNFHYCPNPACHEILNEKAIRRGECKCMKKKKQTK